MKHEQQRADENLKASLCESEKGEKKEGNLLCTEQRNDRNIFEHYEEGSDISNNLHNLDYWRRLHGKKLQDVNQQ